MKTDIMINEIERVVSKGNADKETVTIIAHLLWELESGLEKAHKRIDELEAKADRGSPDVPEEEVALDPVVIVPKPSVAAAKQARPARPARTKASAK